MMNDSTVRDFVSAQSSLSPKQLMSAIIISSLAIMATVVAGSYYTIYIVTEGEGFSKLLGGG